MNLEYIAEVVRTYGEYIVSADTLKTLYLMLLALECLERINPELERMFHAVRQICVWRMREIGKGLTTLR